MGQWVAAARTKRLWTQRELVRFLFQKARIERGHRSPSPSLRRRLAEALELEAEVFYSGGTVALPSAPTTESGPEETRGGTQLKPQFQIVRGVGVDAPLRRA